MLTRHGFYITGLLILLVSPPPAWAYNDPNLGNFIFQILFPAITAISTGCIVFRNFIRRKISSLKSRLMGSRGKDSSGLE